ncbi:SH3 domain-containing protein [Caulobacter sp.]|uniref:SH3 domain-containing protein n=1 Tax=Caulobacter sp. TaxID=78 RepID=UPI00161B48FF
MTMKPALAVIAIATTLAGFSLIHPVQAEERGHVTASSLKCRATPEPTGQVVAKLRRGDRVRIVGHSGAWARIRTPTHPPCWAAQRYLAPNADAYRGR